MNSRWKRPIVMVAASAGLLVIQPISAAAAVEALVTTGSPQTPFPQNKQNEPAVARDPISGTLIAGSNDEIDLQPCFQTSTGAGRCPFTRGVGLSGVYFSFDQGASWTQPTYTGWSARTGTPGTGPIGTLPNYLEAGLVSGGDPGVAVGPRPGPNGGFSWGNGSRFYYSNLTSNFPGSSTLVTPFFAVGVSHTDDAQAAAAGGDNSVWSAPAIASGRLNPVLFDDKSMIWVDNAASSPFFGRVYVSWTAFRAAISSGAAEPEPIMVAHSNDGGGTWSAPVQISSATNNSRTLGRQGSTIRTDSHGIVYVFFEGATPQLGAAQLMARSFNGGDTFETPRAVAKVTDVGIFDAFAGRFTFDGFAGARTNSFPSADIANGAPTGVGASNRILLGWSDARNGTGNEEALLQTSTDAGKTWSKPVGVQAAGDRPDFTAVAISQDGSQAFAVYDAFHAVYADLNDPRPMEGVVLAGPGNLSGPFSVINRGVSGDARATSSNSLVSEFLGDYNQAVASNGGVVAVWNDVRNGDSCDAVNQFRTALRTGSMASANAVAGVDWGEDSAIAAETDTTPPRPFPGADCPPFFGNTDIFSGGA